MLVPVREYILSSRFLADVIFLSQRPGAKVTETVMILYHAASSYYSMIARLALLEGGVPFESHPMDIHFTQQQNTAWYTAINPHMTVPSLVGDGVLLIDSRDILARAAGTAGAAWMDSDTAAAPQIAAAVEGHYQIPIERLTFARLMTRIWPLRMVFPRLLAGINRKLNAALPTAKDADAIRRKIALNDERIAYFTTGDLGQKLRAERDTVTGFLRALPKPQPFLFGERISSADIVVAVLLGRLAMIGEQGLFTDLPEINGWFEMMRAREAFQRADIWLSFQPLRLLSRR